MSTSNNNGNNEAQVGTPIGDPKSPVPYPPHEHPSMQDLTRHVFRSGVTIWTTASGKVQFAVHATDDAIPDEVVGPARLDYAKDEALRVYRTLLDELGAKTPQAPRPTQENVLARRPTSGRPRARSRVRSDSRRTPPRSTSIAWCRQAWSRSGFVKGRRRSTAERRSPHDRGGPSRSFAFLVSTSSWRAFVTTQPPSTQQDTGGGVGRLALVAMLLALMPTKHCSWCDRDLPVAMFNAA